LSDDARIRDLLDILDALVGIESEIEQQPKHVRPPSNPYARASASYASWSSKVAPPAAL